MATLKTYQHALIVVCLCTGALQLQTTGACKPITGCLRGSNSGIDPENEVNYCLDTENNTLYVCQSGEWKEVRIFVFLSRIGKLQLKGAFEDILNQVESSTKSSTHNNKYEPTVRLKFLCVQCIYFRKCN